MTYIETQGRQRERLPTKAQINAISDIEALEALKDDVDRRMVRIETDLDFRDATEEWEGRAISALSVHRYTAKAIGRRIQDLKKSSGKRSFTQERVDCDDLTWEVIDGVYDDVDPDTVHEIDEWLEVIDKALDAVELDKADELSKADQFRDLVWIAKANSAAKRVKGVRHKLFTKKAHINKAIKETERLAHEEVRERMFIDACREMLPKSTYAALWDRVDRQLINAA